MVRVGNEESVREAIGCIREVGRQNEMALPDLRSELASTPAGTRLDLASLRAALPTPMSGEVATAYVMLIAARRDMSGVPELLALLPANLPPRYTGSPPPPLEALLRFDSTEVCQRARGEVERLHAAGQLDAKTYELVARVLDERLRLARATLAPTLGEAELMEALRAPDLERATQAAGRLGERGSEAALEVILEREDTRLIDAYARGAAFAGPRAMSTPHIDALFGLL